MILFWHCFDIISISIQHWNNIIKIILMISFRYCFDIVLISFQYRFNIKTISKWYRNDNTLFDIASILYRYRNNVETISKWCRLKTWSFCKETIHAAEIQKNLDLGFEISAIVNLIWDLGFRIGHFEFRWHVYTKPKIKKKF